MVKISSVILSLMCTISHLKAEKTPELNLTKITTNIETVQNPNQDQRLKNKGLEKITDGDTKSYYWTGTQMRKGQWIHFEFNKPIPKGKTLKIYTGIGIENREDSDILRDAVLQASSDQAQTWQTVARFHCGNAEVRAPIASRHYRIKITASSGYWAAIRELKISNSSLTQKTMTSSTILNGKKYELRATVDLEGFADLERDLIKTGDLYTQIWPKIVRWLGADPDKTTRDIDILLVHTLTHPAHASGHTMTLNAKHLRSHPRDLEGVFVHELTHIIQAYPTSQPRWFIEGAADYTRYRQFPDRAWASSSRASMNNAQPLGQYWNSASFLLWMEDTYQKPITATISRALQARAYKENLFKQLTGKNLPELIQIYKKSKYRPKRNSPITQDS